MLEVCFVLLVWLGEEVVVVENWCVGYVALTGFAYRLWSGLVVGIGIEDRG